MKRIFHLIMVCMAAFVSACQTTREEVSSDPKKFACDKRQITCDGRVVYRIPDSRVDAVFKGPILFSGSVFFIDCETNAFIRFDGDRLATKQNFSRSRSSILSLNDWSNYGARSIVLTSKGILVWTGDGRAHMITKSLSSRRVTSLDVRIWEEVYPDTFWLDSQHSGVVDLTCSLHRAHDCVLTIDLDREVKIAFRKEPNKAPEPTTMAVTSPAAQEPRQP